MTESRSRDGALPFEKMQAVGNDFVVVEEASWAGRDFAAVAALLCDRHFGVGADGLLILGPSAAADFRMRMFNPDGTEDDCGNGMRCAAHYLCRRRPFQRMTLETLSGNHAVEILEHSPLVSRVRLGMGAPRFAPADIPMAVDAGPVVDYPLSVGEGRVRPFTCLFTGSTHAVTFLPGPVEDRVFREESPLLEHHPLFPRRTSVLWAWKEQEDQVRVRIWERGVGETLGCGTGACAVGVAARLHRLASGGVTVSSAGGDIEVDWSPGEEIRMTGAAATVYEGWWPVPEVSAAR